MRPSLNVVKKQKIGRKR